MTNNQEASPNVVHSQQATAMPAPSTTPDRVAELLERAQAEIQAQPPTGKMKQSDELELPILDLEASKLEPLPPLALNEPVVTEAEPWAKGDTVSGATKPVKVQTGYTILVPTFISEGEKIRIDTRTGEYLTRVKG